MYEATSIERSAVCTNVERRTCSCRVSVFGMHGMAAKVYCMANSFDPRKLLKRVSNKLLKELFSQSGEATDCPWDELSEHQIKPIFDAWQSMADERRRLVQLVLQDVNELADERGTKVLVEEISRIAPERLAEFEAMSAHADRALWTYLNVKAAFIVASYFARADALATGRYWISRNGLPKSPIEVTESHKAALKAALTEFYWNRQMRGRICEVEHYTRKGGCEYFFAYLDDYPDDPVVFNALGQLAKSTERRVFDNVFVFNPSEGTLDVYVKGGKLVYEPLQEHFCKAVLGLNVGREDPLKAAYTLDHLLRPDRVLRTDPSDRIVSVAITRVRLALLGRPSEYVELGLKDARGVNRLDEAVAEYLNANRLHAGSVSVLHMAFTLKFAEGASCRQMTFNVRFPNSCDLKSKHDDQRTIGERCLRLWGVTRE